MNKWLFCCLIFGSTWACAGGGIHRNDVPAKTYYPATEAVKQSLNISGDWAQFDARAFYRSYKNFNVERPKGWRLATKDDVVDDWARLNEPNKVVHDFDENGYLDVAQVLLPADPDKTGYRVVVDMYRQNGVQQFSLETGEGAAQNIGIWLEAPKAEALESACSKEYWACEDGEVRQFKVMRPSISMCYIESGCSIWMWNEHKEQFVRVVVSD